jgi:biopolymer transport protein ExbD
MSSVAEQDDEEMISGINITPMVDITLVLLIIFMATAHMIMHRAMNLSLPKVTNSDEAPTRTIQITLLADKSLKLNGAITTQQDLGYNLGQMSRLDPSLKVTIMADSRVDWGDVASVLDIARGAGITHIATEVERKTGSKP